MPNALQICSNDGIEGIRFFLYQDEIVDCVNSARSASSYSVHYSGRGFCRKELPVQFPEGRRQSDGRFPLLGVELNRILKNQE